MKYPCRLDKYLSKAKLISRSDAKKLIKSNRLKVNQQLAKNAQLAIKQDDSVFLDDQLLSLQEHCYFMLNKPSGYLSTEAEANHPSALSLITELSNPLHSAGRLDVDTTGLLLLTNDGQWSHRVTSPRANKFKQYRVDLADAIGEQELQQLRDGLMLRGEDKPTKPALVEYINATQIVLQISEGRYHQVKRMLAAVGNKVVGLHREKIGDIGLDASLKPGEYRALRAEEISCF
ncbi:ribosomal small subunit pseudouridine synthase A [Agarivorans sp. Toyoura001]|uniref:pseudouridine synthase n=1 Tax=Agarivorans sp. Toyoura001 TaxID=2283141 RepID=UPI0010F2A575|nr:pseudouridine synthase [Agarivorans sp. Toyoura001]GDY27439.1 ribosomal small subunit pseudouridine synthase A [Agarivorans sp. Toyoura001]